MITTLISTMRIVYVDVSRVWPSSFSRRINECIPQKRRNYIFLLMACPRSPRFVRQLLWFWNWRSAILFDSRVYQSIVLFPNHGRIESLGSYLNLLRLREYSVTREFPLFAQAYLVCFLNIFTREKSSRGGCDCTYMNIRGRLLLRKLYFNRTQLK